MAKFGGFGNFGFHLGEMDGYCSPSLSFTGAGEVEYTPREKEPMQELTAGPYRGVELAIPEKPAAPDKGLARAFRKTAKEVAKKLRQEWEKEDKERLERHRKEEKEKRHKRIILLEEKIVPAYLQKIKTQAEGGEFQLEIRDSVAFNRLLGLKFPDELYDDFLRESDLPLLKDMIRRYGFRCRLKKRKFFLVRRKRPILTVSW